MTVADLEAGRVGCADQPLDLLDLLDLLDGVAP